MFERFLDTRASDGNDISIRHIEPMRRYDRASQGARLGQLSEAGTTTMQHTRLIPAA
jgi:hypothetical protein